MSKTPTPDGLSADQHRRRMIGRLAWLVGLMAPVGAGLGFAAGYLSARDTLPAPFQALGAVLNSPWFLSAVLAVLSIWAVIATLAYWRAIDELAREAHKSAWFWGGSIGLSLGIFGLFGLSLFEPLPTTMLQDEPPLRLMAIGAYGSFGCGLIGYLIAWAIIWWRAR